MRLERTILARVVTFLRVELGEDVSTVDGETTLGDDLGFSPGLIDNQFRRGVQTWFADLEVEVDPGTWNESSDLSTVAKEVLAASSMTTALSYRSHVTALTRSTWARKIGADTIPVADRPKARAALNAALRTVLLRDVALSDLTGSRDEIVPRIVARMLV